MNNKNSNGNGAAKKGSKATAATMAGVAGAMIGAGVAVAATTVLSDKKNRDKVRDTFKSVKKQVMGAVEEMEKKNKNSQNGQRKLNTASKKPTKSKSEDQGRATEEMMQPQMRG